jgi:hypothetical protein
LQNHPNLTHPFFNRQSSSLHFFEFRMILMAGSYSMAWNIELPSAIGVDLVGVEEFWWESIEWASEPALFAWD